MRVNVPEWFGSKRHFRPFSSFCMQSNKQLNIVIGDMDVPFHNFLDLNYIAGTVTLDGVKNVLAYLSS